MNWEKELKEILEGMNDIQKKAYQLGYKRGFEDGKKAKEKEIENYYRWLDEKMDELREMEFDRKSL